MIPAILGGIAVGIGVAIGEKVGRKYVAPIVEEQMELFKESFEIWYGKCNKNIREQYDDYADPTDDEKTEDIVVDTRVEWPSE